MGKTPPACSSTNPGSFGDEASKTLYVPDEAIDAYKNAQEWKDFGKILPLSVTGVDGVDNAVVELSSHDGMVVVNNVPPEVPVSIYTIAGALLHSGRGNATIDAGRGQLVVVKVGIRNYKLLVK